MLYVYTQCLPNCLSRSVGNILWRSIILYCPERQSRSRQYSRIHVEKDAKVRPQYVVDFGLMLNASAHLAHARTISGCTNTFFSALDQGNNMRVGCTHTDRVHCGLPLSFVVLC